MENGNKPEETTETKDPDGTENGTEGTTEPNYIRNITMTTNGLSSKELKDPDETETRREENGTEGTPSSNYIQNITMTANGLGSKELKDPLETETRREENGTEGTAEPNYIQNITMTTNGLSSKELKDPDETETRREENGTEGTPSSNYIQNITMTANGLSSKDLKEGTLLLDSSAVVRFSPVWKQSLAAAAPILLTFTAGLTSGYSAVLLPQLRAPGSIIPWDAHTDSWIAAMAALPMAPGCLISGWIMERFGRRAANYVLCGPFLLGWILIACARGLPLMLLGRFFTGLCVGILGPLSPVYIGETSEPRYRGFFSAALALAIAIGIFVAHIIGTFMSWEWTAIICCVFPVLSLGLLTLIPESPTWLISRGQTEAGVKAFHWLRGYGDEAKIELKGLLDKQKIIESEPVPTWQEKLTYLKRPEFLKPLFIMIIFFITCQFSGVNAIAFYSVHMVEKAVGKGLDHYLVMLLIDALRIVVSVVACGVCKQFGRRPLCFISGAFTALSMICLSLFLFWADGKPTGMTWIPLTCLMVYITAISIGLVPLPWIMCGEVFPTRVRGLGSGISSATTFVAFFMVVKSTPGMMSSLGEVVTFLLYGIVAFVGTAVLYFVLPETKGKSLQEIEDGFKLNTKGEPV